MTAVDGPYEKQSPAETSNDDRAIQRAAS